MKNANESEPAGRSVTDIVAANLRSLRGEASATRKAIIDRLAERGTMMHPTTLKRIEEATQQAKIDELVALADAYAVSLEFLVTSRRPEVQAEKSVQEAISTEIEIEECAAKLTRIDVEIRALSKSGEHQALDDASAAVGEAVVLLDGATKEVRSLLYKALDRLTGQSGETPVR